MSSQSLRNKLMDHNFDLMTYWHELIDHHEQGCSTDQHLNTDEIQHFLDSLPHLPEPTLQLIQDYVNRGMDIMTVISAVNSIDLNAANHSLDFSDAFGTLQDLGSKTSSIDSLSTAFGTLAEVSFDNAGKHSQASVMESAHSTLTNKPSVTIDSDGKVWRHNPDGGNHHVGYVDNGCFKNLMGREVGYAHHSQFYTDHYMIKEYGQVHGGIIFDDKGNKIGTADTDLEGHAYIAFIVRGGMR